MFEGMKHTFEGETLQSILGHTLTTDGTPLPTFSQQYDNVTPDRGLWVVGDEGVYLMSNVNQPKESGDGSVVCYANEVNPETMEFEDWWAAKRRGFGADDGVEFVSLPDRTDNIAKVEIFMSPEEMRVEWIYHE